MKRPSSAWMWWDLAAVTALALIGLALALVAAPGWLRVIGLTPLVVILPGYAVAAALFPTATLPRDDHILYSVAFSIGATALGGLGLEVFLRLDRPAWAMLLASLTVLASAVALARRHTLPRDASQVCPSLSNVNPLSAVAILAAAAISGGAIAIAIHGVHRQREQSHFTSLWVLPPSGGHQSARGSVAIGVWNHEGAGVNYRLLVNRGNATVRDWRIHVDSNQRWSTSLSASVGSGTGPLVVGVYRGASLYARSVLKARPTS